MKIANPSKGGDAKPRV